MESGRPRSRPRSRPDGIERPWPGRLAPSDPRYAEILERHWRAIEECRTTYLDPATHRSVFTARFLLDRGYCCDSGCRHCPYVGATLVSDE